MGFAGFKARGLHRLEIQTLQPAGFEVVLQRQVIFLHHHLLRAELIGKERIALVQCEAGHQDHGAVIVLVRIGILQILKVDLQQRGISLLTIRQHFLRHAVQVRRHGIAVRQIDQDLLLDRRLRRCCRNKRDLFLFSLCRYCGCIATYKYS